MTKYSRRKTSIKNCGKTGGPRRSCEKHSCISTTFHFPRFETRGIDITREKTASREGETCKSVAIAGRSGRSSAETIRARVHTHMRVRRTSGQRLPGPRNFLAAYMHARMHAHVSRPCLALRNGNDSLFLYDITRAPHEYARRQRWPRDRLPSIDSVSPGILTKRPV